MPVEEDFVTLETPEADWQKYRTVKLNETAVFPREAQRVFLSFRAELLVCIISP